MDNPPGLKVLHGVCDLIGVEVEGAQIQSGAVLLEVTKEIAERGYFFHLCECVSVCVCVCVCECLWCVCVCV